jgi:TonB-dependent SusC/RagA subfamily outer membrane receptor
MRQFRFGIVPLLLLAASPPTAAQSPPLVQTSAAPGIRVTAPPESPPLISVVPTELPSALAPAVSPPVLVGTITGIVIDARTRQPAASTQVHIPALQLGAIAQSNGRFLLTNVPAGTHVLRAERIGFRPVIREVTVVDNQTLEVNLELTEDALSLDEIVVTGTAGAARRREVGNTMAQINVTDVREPVQSIDQLLQARATGLYVTGGSGGSGNGARIRLRGLVSMSMSNQPLIYLDGMRIKSEAYPAGPSGPQDRQSPLNDINPNDIDRVEIIKGAAATTLYGTEAAAGVIQIFTKSGSGGTAPVWTAQVDQGINYIRPWGPDMNACAMGARWPLPASAEVINCRFMFHEPILRNGHRQRYALSVGGGAQSLSYFLSAAMDDSEGGILTDWEKRWSLRGNASFRPASTVSFQFTSSFTTQNVQNTRQGNTGTSTVMVANQEYWGPESRTETALQEMLRRTSTRDLNRFITGVTATYEPFANLSNKFTAGFDLADWRGSHETPYGWRFPDAELGQMTRQVAQTVTTSFEFTSTYRLQVTPEFRSTFSVGAQSVKTKEEVVEAIGRDFPGPGDFTVTSTARREGNQSLLTVVTGGVFAQGLFDYKDRYFLTLGIRVDGNSSFGKDFGLQPYPKVSLAHVLSDEAFWPEALGSVKLRAAYGQAGRAPGAFDAVRTWNPTGYGASRSALLPGNLGNPDMGPERTQEFELGFDGAFLGGRLRSDYTYYKRTTSDALFQVRPPLSDGNWGSQLENVGEIETWGHELQLGATVLDLSSLSWDVGLGISTNGSEVVSLGGAPRFSLGNSTWVEEGQPAPVVRGNMITNFWDQAQPVLVNDTVFGPASPTFILTPSVSFTLPGGIALSGRAEYSGGWWLTSTQESTVMTRRLDWPACYPAYDKRAQGRDAELYAWEHAKCFMGLPGLYINPGDLFEIRDITLSVPVTRFVPRSNNAQLTISSRNLAYWTKKELMVGHPEANAQGGSGISQITRNIAEQLPPSSSLVAVLRITF